MIENAEKFFAIYEQDAALRERIEVASRDYPGSYEIREAYVSAVLLPFAEELGLPFTVSELRAYETRLKMQRFTQSNEDYFDTLTDGGFWLLDNGWTNDEEIFKEER